LKNNQVNNETMDFTNHNIPFNSCN
jgi:hypothetical protein